MFFFFFEKNILCFLSNTKISSGKRHHNAWYCFFLTFRVLSICLCIFLSLPFFQRFVFNSRGRFHWLEKTIVRVSPVVEAERA